MHYNLLLVSLVNLHGFLDYGDFFDCELDSAELDDVATLHNVVYFAVIVLQAPHNQVHVFVQLLRHRCDAAPL